MHYVMILFNSSSIQSNNFSLKDICKSYETGRAFSISVASFFIDNGQNPKELFSRQSEVKRPAASLAKLFVLGALAEDISRGRYNLAKQLTVSNYVAGSGILKYVGAPMILTIQELACLMIAYSDNSATNALLSLITIERVNTFINQLGARDTKIIVPMMPTTTEAEQGYNYTNTDNVALFYSGVANGFPAPIHPSTAQVCRELFIVNNGSLANFAQFLTSGMNARCAVKIMKHNPFMIIKYLYAIFAPLQKRRLCANVPAKQIIAQKSATDRHIFHDSCLIKLSSGFLCIVSMIECSSAYFYRRMSKDYRLANSLTRKIGETVFMIQK